MLFSPNLPNNEQHNLNVQRTTQIYVVRHLDDPMSIDGLVRIEFPLFVDYHGLILGYPDNKQVLHMVFPKS
jgi:hypothetical protein